MLKTYYLFSASFLYKIYMKMFQKKNPEKFKDFAGWGRGYVIIDKDHPLFGKEYYDIIKEYPEFNDDIELTFSEHVKDLFWPECIGYEDGYVLGFHTNYIDKKDWSKEEVIKHTILLKNKLKKIQKKTNINKDILF